MTRSPTDMDYHIDKSKKKQCDWKKILLCLLGLLLLLGSALGLYLLISSLSSNNNVEIDDIDLIEDGQGGVNPIDLNPISEDPY